jgi:peptidoglycan hydrolase CwlO-like protein
MEEANMKKNLVVLMALALFAVASPVLADDMQMDGMKMDGMQMEHGASHGAMDEKCAKECAMLLKNCAQEVDSIQAEIKKLQVQIDQKGADTYTLEELKTLNAKLKKTNATLRDLQKPGK